MNWAFSGTPISSAFSTARTEAIAWTVVHTPQKRCVIAQASRGSRPSRICSTPRHIVPDAQAFVTLPPSTLAVDPQVPFDAGDRVDGDTL